MRDLLLVIVVPPSHSWKPGKRSIEPKVRYSDCFGVPTSIQKLDELIRVKSQTLVESWQQRPPQHAVRTRDPTNVCVLQIFLRSSWAN